jgi:hypothetical protein
MCIQYSTRTAHAGVAGSPLLCSGILSSAYGTCALPANGRSWQFPAPSARFWCNPLPQTRPGQAKPKHARARPLGMAWHGIAWRGAGATGGDAPTARGRREKKMNGCCRPLPAPVRVLYSTLLYSTMNPTSPLPGTLILLMSPLSLSVSFSRAT